MGLWGSAIVLAAAAVYSYSADGLLGQLTNSNLDSAQRMSLVREWILAWGPIAPLAYVALVTVEVVIAPLPGLMLYAPGGAIFGGFWGGLLSLIGNVLGAGLACQLMRRLGRARLAWMFAGETLAALDARAERSGLWLIALLRVNPLTSSDLVSYAAGLTSLRTWKVMAGTLLGMAPLCWTQAYLAEGLVTRFPALVYPLAVLCGVYLLAAVWILRRTLVRRSSLLVTSTPKR